MCSTCNGAGDSACTSCNGVETLANGVCSGPCDEAGGFRDTSDGKTVDIDVSIELSGIVKSVIEENVNVVDFANSLATEIEKKLEEGKDAVSVDTNVVTTAVVTANYGTSATDNLIVEYQITVDQGYYETITNLVAQVVTKQGDTSPAHQAITGMDNM